MTCAFKSRRELYSQWGGGGEGMTRKRKSWEKNKNKKTKKQAKAETKLLSAQPQILVKESSERSETSRNL